LVSLRTKLLASAAYPCLLVFILVFGLPVIHIPQTGLSGYVSESLAHIGYLILAIIIGSILGTIAWPFRYKLPVLKGFFLNRDYYMLTETLGSLLSAGVPIAMAWNMIPQIRHKLTAHWLSKGKTAIETGQSPFKLLNSVEFHKMDHAFVDYVLVGEQTGKLSENLLQLSRRFMAQMITSLKVLAVIASSVLMALVVAAVIYSVVSFYLGYFSQIDAILK
jgi:type II secretory pathway component PulF